MRHCSATTREKPRARDWEQLLDAVKVAPTGRPNQSFISTLEAVVEKVTALLFCWPQRPLGRIELTPAAAGPNQMLICRGSAPSCNSYGTPLRSPGPTGRPPVSNQLADVSAAVSSHLRSDTHDHRWCSSGCATAAVSTLLTTEVPGVAPGTRKRAAQAPVKRMPKVAAQRVQPVALQAQLQLAKLSVPIRRYRSRFP